MKTVVSTLLALILWTTGVVTGALFGWWRTPIVPADDPQSFTRAATALSEQTNRGNSALLLIENGAISAEYYSSVADPVDRNTVFATASLSKWIAALGVMKLVEQGKLDLDRPGEDYLTRWRLPASPFDHRGVTARRLLSHTAGLTDRLGFGNYLRTEAVPTLEQSLAAPRASSGKPVSVAVGKEPGTTWQYSGGGYLLLELMVEEVSGESFETFIMRTILQPLGMTRSGYSDLGALENSAKSYDRDGRPAAVYRYASKAATGFHTSTADMAKLVLAHLAEGPASPLAAATLVTMRRPQAKALGVDVWGLGTILYAPVSDDDFVFGHDGTNEPAISATVRINPETKDGIVVLVTGSPELASTLGREWVLWQTGMPDVLSLPGEIRRVVPALLGGVLAILSLAVWRVRRTRGAQRPRKGEA